MQRSRKSEKNISLVFSTIIILSLGLGFTALFYLQKISSEIEKLHLHPYAVSNASKNISINLMLMDRDMSEVVHAENGPKILQAVNKVYQHERIVYKNFDLIFNRYLGKQSDIQSAYKTFTDWKEIRDEVIALKVAGKNNQAIETLNSKGKAHAVLLNQETQKLLSFADNKAKAFVANAVKGKNSAIFIVAILLLITIAASIFISYHAVRSLNLAYKNTQSRMHLIDQNILMAKYDLDGVITDISSKLCRHLGTTKEKMLGKQVNFFTDDCNKNGLVEQILAVISTGKIWEGEIPLASNEGISRWIFSSLYPELDENYVVKGYTNIINDISNRKAVEELAITDPLTQLHNRREFSHVIDRELKMARREKSPLVFAIIDIDYFKKYNDYYGHPAGDLVLRRVAAIFKHSLERPNDFVFRLGGEEFGLLFADSDIDKTVNFLEHLRKKVEDLQIVHTDSEVCPYISISIGAHICTSDEILDSNQLYIAADKALYEAKEQRNSVVVT